MLRNTPGKVFRVTTSRESYGIGKGSELSIIVDGVSPIEINKRGDPGGFG